LALKGRTHLRMRLIHDRAPPRSDRVGRLQEQPASGC
jgi:hypothetical protein